MSKLLDCSCTSDGRSCASVFDNFIQAIQTFNEKADAAFFASGVHANTNKNVYAALENFHTRTITAR
jgi:hypothetical protein